MPTYKHPCPHCGTFINRDVVACPRCGTRDPFVSLIESNAVGPTITDLRLVSITYDARYGNSVAIVWCASW